MSVRKCALILAITCASALVVPVAASAAKTSQAHVKSFNRVPIAGQAANGKTFKGHFAIQRFVTSRHKTYAIGTLTGHLGRRFVRRSNVAIPIVVNRPMASSAATCPILHLTLGPLNLNLLGLHVHLNRVVLDITAVSGPGNLLGNLLCDVANLLNSQSLLQQEVTGLLNTLQQLLGTPALLTL